jgi:hypothetical protein
LGEWWKFGYIKYLDLAGAGTQTAALGFGGYTPSPFVATSASYNGSSWTGTPSLNTARYALGGAGTQTAALSFWRRWSSWKC